MYVQTTFESAHSHSVYFIPVNLPFPTTMSSAAYVALHANPAASKDGTDLTTPYSSKRNIQIAERGSDHYEFDVGSVEMMVPDEEILNSPELKSNQHVCENACIKFPLCLLSLPLPCYFLSKISCIRQNEIGVVTHMMGGAHLLPSGCHFSGCCTTVKKFEIKSDLIRNGNMWIVRILPGQYGLAKKSGKPLLMLPGRHAISDPLFEYLRSVDITADVVEHITIKVITVPVGKLGLCMVKGEGFFLQPGRHFLNNPNLRYLGFKDVTVECINVGTKYRIMIPDGKVGLAWDKGKPIVLDHGQVYNISSQNFRYVKSVDLRSPVIEHGAIKMVTVREGVYGISYNDGVMEILSPARHVLTKGTHFFAGFLPSGQQTLSIEAVTSMSADNVGIRFDSALTIQVSDPKLAVLNLGTVPNEATNQQVFLLDEFYKNITAMAKLALSIIIGNNKLNQSFESTQRKPITIVVEGESDQVDPEATDSTGSTSFKQHVHDVFMLQFTTNMEKCGIRVVDMSIEDVEITNEMLAKAMAKGAVAATELEKVRLEQISTITAAKGKSQSMQILAQAQADAIRTIDEAMQNVSEVTQQQELIKQAGEVLGKTQSTLVLADNIGALAPLLAGGGRGALTGVGK